MATRGSKHIEIVYLPGDKEVFGDVIKNEWNLRKRVGSDSSFSRKRRTKLFTAWPRSDVDPTPVEFEA